MKSHKVYDQIKQLLLQSWPTHWGTLVSASWVFNNKSMPAFHFYRKETVSLVIVLAMHYTPFHAEWHGSLKVQVRQRLCCYFLDLRSIRGEFISDSYNKQWITLRVGCDSEESRSTFWDRRLVNCYEKLFPRQEKCYYFIPNIRLSSQKQCKRR